MSSGDDGSDDGGGEHGQGQPGEQVGRGQEGEDGPTATFAALAHQAHDWATRHRTDQPTVGPSAGHWAARAAATADLLTAASLALSEHRPGESTAKDQP